MDTKSKKWKGVVSFISFAAGISILVGLPAAMLNYFTYGTAVEDGFVQDYQKTGAFRDNMSAYLRNFLSMSVDGPLVIEMGLFDYYDQIYSDLYRELSESENRELYSGEYSVSVAEQPPAAEVSIEAGSEKESEAYESAGVDTTAEVAVVSDPNEYGYAEVYGSTVWQGRESAVFGAGSPEGNRKAAEKLHEYMTQDQNLLYRVSKDGKVLYENTGAQLVGEDGSVKLPDGYNFMLIFDGKNVNVFKDGERADVYGDGVFTEDSRWKVPGYRNYPVAPEYGKSEVILCAAKNPIPYVLDSAGNMRAGSFYGTLYRLSQNVGYRTVIRRGWQIGLLACAILLTVYVALRRYKRAGDRVLACVLGRFWFETKLLLSAFLLAMVVYWNWDALDTFIWMLGEGRGGLRISFLEGELKNLSLSVILLFWTFYLWWVDFKWNDRPWKNSFYRRIKSQFLALTSRGLGRSYQKRIFGRFRLSALTGMIPAVVAVIFLIYMEAEGEVDAAPFILLLAAFMLPQLYQVTRMKAFKQTAADMGVLLDGIESVKRGDYSAQADVAEDADIRKALSNLHDIGQGMERTVEEKMKSERMKVELISNVSHDLKTPLTSIISYVDLLKKEEDMPERAKEYVSILDQKSQRLKAMVQDVFEVSKAASGQLPVRMERLDLGKLLRQTLADMAEQIEQAPFLLKTDIPEEEVMIEADGQRLYRVFQNLIQNALQYSLEGSRIYVTLKRDEGMAAASVKNTSCRELNGEMDFTGRFVRGDESRSDGGSGLGLSIAQSFTEACGGAFEVKVIADLFVAVAAFPIV